LTVRGPRENNLNGDDVLLPLGVLAGVCGVSGSGKSTLVVDTVGRALAPPRLTTSVAFERYDPGEHDGIEGAPARTVVADQGRAGMTSPGAWLGIIAALRAAFAASDKALTLGLSEPDLARSCDACSGGVVAERMGFLPDITHACDACEGTGYPREVRELAVRGRTLPETEALTLEELLEAWGDVPAVKKAGEAAQRLGLGYLVVRQASWSLSGGEAQRLKLVRELMRSTPSRTLYILDEPTVGLHALDIVRLAAVLDELVEAGHSVLVVEHHPELLACCDHLTELGPGGGPDGGRVVAQGTPEELVHRGTPTSRWLGQALRGRA
jgi:excinuclease ABC subunit A